MLTAWEKKLLWSLFMLTVSWLTGNYDTDKKALKGVFVHEQVFQLQATMYPMCKRFEQKQSDFSASVSEKIIKHEWKSQSISDALKLKDHVSWREKKINSIKSDSKYLNSIRTQLQQQTYWQTWIFHCFKLLLMDSAKIYFSKSVKLTQCAEIAQDCQNLREGDVQSWCRSSFIAAMRLLWRRSFPPQWMRSAGTVLPRHKGNGPRRGEGSSTSD